MKNKEEVSRMCVVTRKVQKTSNMIRISRSKDGNYSIGNSEDQNLGRGAYISKKLSLWNKLYSKKILNRVFKTQVPSHVYLSIKEELNKYEKK